MKSSKIKINYIPEIKAAIFGRKKPAMVSVNLTNKCNQHCIYCEIGNDSLPTTTSLLTKEDMFWLIDQMELEGIQRLSMCGGEPFLFPELIDVVAYARKRIIKSNITSNGMTIHKLTGHELKTLSHSNCQVNISVDSFNPEIQSLTRGNAQALSNAIRSIKLLQNNNIQVTLLSAISKHNYSDLFESFQSAYKLGIKEVLYQPIISVSNYADLKKLENKKNLNVPMSALTELNAQLNKILHFEKTHPIKTNIYRLKPWINNYIKSVHRPGEKPFYTSVLKKFSCREAQAVIDISYTGGIQPCGLAMAERSIKEIHKSGLVRLWSDATIHFRGKLDDGIFPEICNGCCHKFSRNMLASVLKYPLANRRAAISIFLLLSKRAFNIMLKKTQKTNI